MNRWPICLIFSIFCGIWMISTDTLGWLILHINEAVYIFFWALATPVYIVSLVASLVHLLRTRRDGVKAATMPLLVNMLTFVFAVWPLEGV